MIILILHRKVIKAQKLFLLRQKFQIIFIRRGRHQEREPSAEDRMITNKLIHNEVNKLTDRWMQY